MVIAMKKKLFGTFAASLSLLLPLGCGLANRTPMKTSVGNVGFGQENAEKNNEGATETSVQEDLTLDQLMTTSDEIAAIEEEIRKINENMSTQIDRQDEFDTRLAELEASIAEKEEMIEGFELRLQSVEEQVRVIAALKTAVIALEERLVTLEVNAVQRAEFDALKIQIEELSESQDGTVAIIKTVVSGITILATEVGFPIADLLMGT